jgi:hypothetical protein
MANGVVKETRRTALRCKNGHRYAADITWFAPVVEERDPAPGDWRPDIPGMVCRYGDAPVELDR